MINFPVGLHSLGQLSSSNDRQLDLVPSGRRSVPGRDHLRPGFEPGGPQRGHEPSLPNLPQQDRGQLDILRTPWRKSHVLDGTLELQASAENIKLILVPVCH